jgi:hypothetical protein
MAKGKLAQKTQAAINDIKNPKAQAAAQAEYDRATRGGSPISQKELDRIQSAAAAASPTGGGPAVQRLGQITHPKAPGGGGGGNQQATPEQPTAEDPSVVYQRSRDEAERKSAFQMLEDTFRSYGLDTLANEVRNYMVQGLPYAEGTIRLRQSEAYKTRFAGNTGRIAKGLAAYDPREYLQAEEEYRNLFASAGLGDLSTQENFSSLIGGAVSLTEAQDRITNVFNRIDNAPPELKSQLGRYFSSYGINDEGIQRSQLAKSLLLGDTSAQTLERNLQKAQLYTGATRYGFELPEERIQSLQQQLEAQGTTDFLGKGMTGFQELGESTREVGRLGSFYGSLEKPEEQELEQEAFFGLKSQRRKRLRETEQAAFSGQAGTTTQSLTRDVAGSI